VPAMMPERWPVKEALGMSTWMSTSSSHATYCTRSCLSYQIQRNGACITPKTQASDDESTCRYEACSGADELGLLLLWMTIMARKEHHLRRHLDAAHIGQGHTFPACLVGVVDGLHAKEHTRKSNGTKA
jgi:hypothetical protein